MEKSFSHSGQGWRLLVVDALPLFATPFPSRLALLAALDAAVLLALFPLLVLLPQLVLDPPLDVDASDLTPTLSRYSSSSSIFSKACERLGRSSGGV